MSYPSPDTCEKSYYQSQRITSVVQGSTVHTSMKSLCYTSIPKTYVYKMNIYTYAHTYICIYTYVLYICMCVCIIHIYLSIIFQLKQKREGWGSENHWVGSGLLESSPLGIVSSLERLDGRNFFYCFLPLMQSATDGLEPGHDSKMGNDKIL